MFRSVLTALALITAAGSASAVTLDIRNGALFGASGVTVGSQTYNVSFTDGSCIDNFNGCDGPESFVFSDAGMATAASEALLEQVFLNSAAGDFDGSPMLTAGCGAAKICKALTAYGRDGIFALAVGAFNRNEGSVPDAAAVQNVSADHTIFSALALTWAVWTPAAQPDVSLSPASVPLPAGGLLLGSGLLAAAALRRRKKRRAA